MNKRFSIIMALKPGRNITVLDSIRKMNYPEHNYEIIVKIGHNPSVNRNEGIKQAKGEILAFVDDDCMVEENWLRNAEEFFNKYRNIEVLGGPQLTPPSDSFFARATGNVFASYFGTYKMSSRYKKSSVNLNATELNLTSTNMFVKKRVFDIIDSFDVRLHPNEETELLFRVQRTGVKIAYTPDVIVYHKRRPDLLSFISQCFRYGMGRSKQNRITQARFRLFTILPCAFLFYLVTLPLLVRINFLSLLPLLSYIILTFYFSLFTSFKNHDFKGFVVLPFLFFTIHISYACGIVINEFLEIFKLSKNRKETAHKV